MTPITCGSETNADNSSPTQKGRREDTRRKGKETREQGSRVRGNVRVGLRPESHRKIVDLHVTPITQALIINTTNTSPSRREGGRMQGGKGRNTGGRKTGNVSELRMVTKKIRCFFLETLETIQHFTSNPKTGNDIQTSTFLTNGEEVGT